MVVSFYQVLNALLTIVALAIGNLVRSGKCVDKFSVQTNSRPEENSIIAVKQFKIIPRLVQLLRDDDVKVSHASMCLLKNLSLPASNKDEIGDSGAMEAAQKFLSLSFSHVQPLQFATVGFYKHLCTQQCELSLLNAYRLSNVIQFVTHSQL